MLAGLPANISSKAKPQLNLLTEMVSNNKLSPFFFPFVCRYKNVCLFLSNALT